MAQGLSGKQENFAQKFVEIGNGSAAYRQAYECQNMKAETIHRKAKELLDNGKVAARIAELQEMHRLRHLVTVDRIVSELEKVAFMDVRKLYNDDGTLKHVTEIDSCTAAGIASIEIEELSTGKGKDKSVIGHTKKLTLASKKGALDSLARIFGAAPDKDPNKETGTTINIINYGDKKDDNPSV